MATYIEDEETSRLITEYAELMGTSKTGALRDLLRAEVEKHRRSESPDVRFRRAMAFLEANPPRNRSAVTKKDFDELYEYVNAD